MLFTHYTVLVMEAEEGIKHSNKAIQKVAREHKLQVNWGKTDTMVISRESMECDTEVG